MIKKKTLQASSKKFSGICERCGNPKIISRTWTEELETYF